MSFCFCGKYAPYTYKRQDGSKADFCIEHAPKAKKPQKKKVEKTEEVKMSKEKTSALYYND